MRGSQVEASDDLQVELVLVMFRDNSRVKGVYYCPWVAAGPQWRPCSSYSR